MRRLPVLFHNLRFYDSSYLIRALAEMGYVSRLNVTPTNIEKYLSFSLAVPFEDDSGEKVTMFAVFTDTMQFMAKGLAALAETLADDDFQFMERELNHADGHWNGLFSRSNCDDEKLSAMKRKGIFPYSYLTDTSVFDQTALPPKAAFFNDLTSEPVSDADYDHATTVWQTFGMRTFADYHDVYLICDTILLTIIFERFRKVCQDAYGLDALQYITAPSLSWDACLKMTGISLDLITDPTMMSFYEKSVKGGYSCISHRLARANHENVRLNFGDEPVGFDETRPKTFISYLDANPVDLVNLKLGA